MGEKWTVGRLLDWTADYLAEKGCDQPLLSAQLLLANVLGCSKVQLYLRHDQCISPDQRAAFRDLVQRAGGGEPIAYLTSHKEFFSLDFAVGPGVLIPRPETELIVEWVIRHVRTRFSDRSSQPLWILELGTGSGCIAVSLAKFLPLPCRLIAVEISLDALKQARANCIRHEVTDRVTLVAGDMFGPIAADGRFDFIVANLPYVTEDDYQRLPRHIKDFEPSQSLVAGRDGLDRLSTAIAEGTAHMRKGGYLVLEIGYNQRHVVAELLSQYGYEQVDFQQDHAGISRLAIARAGEAH